MIQSKRNVTALHPTCKGNRPIVYTNLVRFGPSEVTVVQLGVGERAELNKDKSTIGKV